MLPAKTARTQSAGTKLTEEEYGRPESMPRPHARGED
jgi:hypothetical protein